MRVALRVYVTSRKKILDWGFWFLTGCCAVCVFAGNAWPIRLLGLGLATFLLYCVVSLLRTRVEISDEAVRVRRLVGWKVYRVGAEFGVETFQPRWGDPERNILLQSPASGRARIPYDRFSDSDQREIRDGIESVLGRKAQRAARRSLRHPRRSA